MTHTTLTISTSCANHVIIRVRPVQHQQHAPLVLSIDNMILITYSVCVVRNTIKIQQPSTVYSATTPAAHAVTTPSVHHVILPNIE